MEQCFFHKDGQIVWTHIHISLIKSKNDKPIFWLVITEDITERKSLEFKLSKSQREAEAASRAKDEFLATVSHELRTPINTIMGLSQLLQEEKIGTLNDKQKESISYIYTSGNDLLALINNMFDISHVETDTKDLLMLPLQVHQLCADVIATVRDSVLEKGLELTTEIDENVDTYIGDERRIKQMLLNLLSNAVKFTSTGKVSLEVNKVTKGILLRISDTGIGIHPDHLKLLFQPFQQLDSQLNRQYEGTGLGLALTRKFARLHGGDVSVESVLGQGSRFSIFLPDQASQRESGISKVEDIESETKRKALEKPLLLSSSITSTAKKIVLVENEDHTANLLQNYLQVIGYQVEWIKDGKDFLTRVRSLQPNLIFVSMDLAASFGDKDLLDKLRAQPDLQNIPVIIMIQTNSLPQNKINLNKYSVTEFISKPFGIFQLESILVKYLT